MQRGVRGEKAVWSAVRRGALRAWDGAKGVALEGASCTLAMERVIGEEGVLKGWSGQEGMVVPAEKIGGKRGARGDWASRIVGGLGGRVARCAADRVGLTAAVEPASFEEGCTTARGVTIEEPDEQSTDEVQFGMRSRVFRKTLGWGMLEEDIDHRCRLGHKMMVGQVRVGQVRALKGLDTALRLARGSEVRVQLQNHRRLDTVLRCISLQGFVYGEIAGESRD